MSLFQHTVLKKHIAAQGDAIAAAYALYKGYFHNHGIQENILNSKEEQFQEGFLRELFVKVLGYTLNPDPGYSLITEKKNEADSKKADGAILLNGEVVGVIELKDYKTTDLKTVEAQAFGYKNNHRKASYVVISNFEKLRFYIDNAIDFKQFLAELKKQKITLSLRQQDEWEEYFNDLRTACQTLTTQITATDHQIDRMVYDLYGLTEAEIKTIDNPLT